MVPAVLHNIAIHLKNYQFEGVDEEQDEMIHNIALINVNLNNNMARRQFLIDNYLARY